MILHYNSKPVRTLVTKDTLEGEKDNGRDITDIVEDAPCAVRVAKQTKIPQRSEEIILLATDTIGLVRIGPLLEQDRTQP